MENMLNLCRERFSARKFTSEKVSQEDLEYVMCAYGPICCQ